MMERLHRPQVLKPRADVEDMVDLAVSETSSLAMHVQQHAAAPG